LSCSLAFQLFVIQLFTNVKRVCLYNVCTEQICEHLDSFQTKKIVLSSENKNTLTKVDTLWSGI